MILILLKYLFIYSGQTKAMDKVLYGSDNRKDIYQVKGSKIEELARSTLALIDNEYLIDEKNYYSIKAPTLADEGICSDEKFSTQFVAAKCTAFLIAPDRVATAAHCIYDLQDCKKYKFVFDYVNYQAEQTHFYIEKKNIFSCQEIISREIDIDSGVDYAILKLDHPENERAPLKLNLKNHIKLNQSVFVLGHPSGLPLKFADDAKVRANDQEAFFQINSDTFSHNSGSPVFNSKTYEVEGILVRGEVDYENDSMSNCTRPKKCKKNECRGEDVTRIQLTKKFFQQSH